MGFLKANSNIYYNKNILIISSRAVCSYLQFIPNFFLSFLIFIPRDLNKTFTIIEETVMMDKGPETVYAFVSIPLNSTTQHDTGL